MSLHRRNWENYVSYSTIFIHFTKHYDDQSKENRNGRTCSKQLGIRNACKICWKTLKEKALGKLIYKWNNNIKREVKELD
jgi:hypothetical protein